MRFSLYKTRIVSALSVVSILFALLVSSFAVAQAPDSITIAVSPQQLDVTANPGERFNNVFRITNVSETAINIKTIPKNFTPRGEEGAVNLTEDDTSFSLADWISVDPEIAEIPGNSSQDFDVAIDVPANAEPGSHFGSVVFQTVPPEQEEAVALVSQEIAPVLLVKIAGDTTESARIAEFTAESGFYSNENAVALVSRIENTGDVHFKPSGQIVIKNLFGNEVSRLELDNQNVLPDSIRKFSTEWALDGFTLGQYTATLTLVTENGNNISTAETSFIVFPYQVVVPVVLILILVVVILYKGRKRIALAAKALSGKDTESKRKDS